MEQRKLGWNQPRWNQRKRSEKCRAGIRREQEELKQMWKKDIKRLKNLKKKIQKMGNVPVGKNKNIAIINFFVKLINEVTNFFDEGLIKASPENKKELSYNFNVFLKGLVRREEDALTMYQNRSNPGEAVTLQNLYLGDAKKAEDGTYKIFVPMKPAVEWITNRELLNSSQEGLNSRFAIRIEIFIQELNQKIDELLN